MLESKIIVRVYLHLKISRVNINLSINIIRFELSKRLFNIKMRKGQSVHDHCMIMIKDLKELEKLGLNMQRELKVDLILQSLTSSFG